MKSILVLEGGVDVTPYIKARGYTWTKNALHSDKTGRTKDGKARVDKIADKLTLTYELGTTPVDKLAAIESVLMKPTFQAITHSVDSGLYEDFSIGNATTAKLTLTLYTDNIPRSATIKRYVRLKNGEQVSEWIPKGVFFTNRRREKDGRWIVEAFDAMRKSDVIWAPEESLKFPLAMLDAVKEFARIIW